MENKIIFLILLIGLVYLLFSANGIQALKKLVTNVSGGSAGGGTDLSNNPDPWGTGNMKPSGKEYSGDFNAPDVAVRG